jgi:hypothetical protein
MRAAWIAIALAGCWPTASSDPGIGDALFVDGAQFRPGDFPAPNGGPAILRVSTAHTSVIVGQNREPLHGTLDPAAQAAIVGIAGVPGAWIATAGPPDFDTPGDASLHATFGVTDALGLGPFTLEIAAVDAAGRIGDAQMIDLTADEAPPPMGDLVVMLEWTGAADLDLHVVDPMGDEAWVGHPNTWQVPQPGSPGVDPCAWATGGILDHDANANCTRAANPREDVIWTTRSCNNMPVTPVIPAGTYTVRVDALSLCGDASEPWAVSVYHEGQLIGGARGIATPDDVSYEPHGNLAGITALQFTL